MIDKDDFSEQDGLINKQKLLKALLFEELVRLTYSESEDCDGERLADLSKIACDDEIIPEEYQGGAFRERFNELHGITSGKSKKESLSNGHRKKQAFYRRSKLFRAASVILVIVLVFSTVNVVTYGSAKQRLLAFITEKVDRLIFSLEDREAVDDYEAEIENSVSIELSIDEYRKIETRDVLLPAKLPEYLTDSKVKMHSSTDTCIVTYFSEDYSQLITIFIYSLLDWKGKISAGYPIDSIKEECQVKIAGKTEMLNIFEAGEGFSTAYIVSEEFIYVFNYTIQTDDFINIIKNMEVL